MSTSIWRSLGAFFIIAAGTVTGAPSASADFTVCNKTWNRVSVAIGYSQDGTWVSEGWWNIDGDDCAVVLGGNLKNQYYYVRGASDSGNWTDDFEFCYMNEAFTIFGDENCHGRGYKTGGFMEVDVGRSLDYTLDLTE